MITKQASILFSLSVVLASNALSGVLTTPSKIQFTVDDKDITCPRAQGCTWNEAMASCQKEQGLLPNIEELETIMKDTEHFPEVSTGVYWSATRNSPYYNKGWRADHGHLRADNFLAEPGSVRCIRRLAQPVVIDLPKHLGTEMKFLTPISKKEIYLRQNPKMPEYPASYKIIPTLTNSEDGICRYLGYQRAIEESATILTESGGAYHGYGFLVDANGNVSALKEGYLVAQITCIQKTDVQKAKERSIFIEQPRHPETGNQFASLDFNHEDGICRALGHKRGVLDSSESNTSVITGDAVQVNDQGEMIRTRSSPAISSIFCID